MSYDLTLRDAENGHTLEADDNHDIAGGTYALGGTPQAWLNITYNYSQHFYRVFGEKGIRTIYGMTGEDSVPVIDKAIGQLGYDIDNDYWKPTEGNARESLVQVRKLAEMFPQGVWHGD